MHLSPNQVIEDLQLANELFSSAHAHQYISRGSRVLITSVHGYPHERNGFIKGADEGTFVFSYLLAKYLNANWAAVGRELLPDSNFYSETEFKQMVKETLTSKHLLCVDIHACHAFRAFDIEIGTAYRKESSKDIDLMNYLNSKGYYCVLNEIFKAQGDGSSQTMTDFFHTLGVNAIQLEISSCFLTGDTRLEWHQRIKLLHFLINAITDYCQHS